MVSEPQAIFLADSAASFMKWTDKDDMTTHQRLLHPVHMDPKSHHMWYIPHDVQ